MRIKFNSLFEGTHHDTDAAKMLVKAGLFTEEEARKIIKDLHDNKIHAFSHANLKKYLKGIVRMCIDYANGDSNKAKEFLDKSAKVFDAYLTYIKDIRDKQEDQTAFDKIFMNQTTYDEVKDFVDNYQKELDQKSKEELKNMEFSDSSNYELIPINNWDEFNEQFGGDITGNGESDGYAGDGHGGTAWCHANNESVYDEWTEHGEKFFVLARKDYMDIPFDSKTNTRLDGKDDYGNSLIAILVDKYGNLNKATLRCNHVGVHTDADYQYKTFADLSKLAGFNVEEKIHRLAEFEESPLKDGVYYYEGGEVPEDLENSIRKVIVKDDVTKIDDYAFYLCKSLESVVIPDSVTYIGGYAFRNCKSLKSITIPDSVTRIGYGAFCYCESLKSIRIPNSVTEIGGYAFENCKSLKSITIPNSVTEIENSAFYDCKSLESITIPNSVTEIDNYAFYDCISLKSIKIPNSVTRIGRDAFSYCESLESITIPDGVTEIESYTFYYCRSLKSITIPDSVTYIEDYAFSSCTNLTVKCNRDSFAYEYCIDNDIKVSTY